VRRGPRGAEPVGRRITSAIRVALAIVGGTVWHLDPREGAPALNAPPSGVPARIEIWP
jgi:hypothetical protein